MNPGKYIITGAPSSGKSTVISELGVMHMVLPEVARTVIQEQLKLKTNKVPWLDNYEFSKLVVTRQIKDFKKGGSSPLFFDRGIPDVIAYLKYYKQIEHVEEFMIYAKKYRYSNKVFILPPCREIYQKDDERTETFEESELINDELLKSYQELNYEIIEVPFDKSAERAKFILQQIFC